MKPTSETSAMLSGHGDISVTPAKWLKFTEAEYERAVEIGRGYGQPSIYYIRQRMRLRYATAVAIVEEMGRRGIAECTEPLGIWKFKPDERMSP